MKDDVLKSVSQTGSGKEDAENHRLVKITDELRRRCQLYEKELRTGQSHVTHFDIEQRVTEQFAKENELWIPMDQVFELGVPGPCGNENDTYVSEHIIYKVNNLLNCGSIFSLFDKIIGHNLLFYDTSYSFYGFTGFEGRSIMPILKQHLVQDAIPATNIEIETYMAAIGFEKVNDGRFVNEQFEVWDLFPRNVLKDSDGDLFIIDAEIKEKKVLVK